MSFDYRPGQGYGPLQFGMRPDAVVAILGEPLATGRVDGHPGFDLVRDDWTAEDRAFFSTKFWMDFCPPDKPDNLRPQLTFHDTRGLIKIRLVNKRQPLLFQGVDLFAAKRVPVILGLAALEEEVWLTSEDYYFPRSRLAVTHPMYWKEVGGITLFEPEEFEAVLDYLDAEGFDAPEVTGKE